MHKLTYSSIWLASFTACTVASNENTHMIFSACYGYHAYKYYSASKCDSHDGTTYLCDNHLKSSLFAYSSGATNN
jgi:hypothetical protein